MSLDISSIIYYLSTIITIFLSLLSTIYYQFLPITDVLYMSVVHHSGHTRQRVALGRSGWPGPSPWRLHGHTPASLATPLVGAALLPLARRRRGTPALSGPREVVPGGSAARLVAWRRAPPRAGMDSFCRVVLSVDAPEAPFAVVEDTVDAIGGNVFLLEASDCLSSTATAGVWRSGRQQVVLVATQILRRGIAAIESKRDSLTHIKIAGCIPRAYPEDVVCHPAVSLSNILELAGACVELHCCRHVQQCYDDRCAKHAGAARDNETSSILTDAGRKRKSVLICLDGVSDLLFTQQSSQVPDPHPWS